MKKKVRSKPGTREARKYWLVWSFGISFLAIIALAAIWQKSQDTSFGETDLISEVGFLTEAGIRSTVTVAELERIRDSLQAQYSGADSTNRIRILKLRIAIADRGLEIAKSNKDRKSFQLQKMRMILVLCWADRENKSIRPELQQQARDLSTSFIDDADQELSWEALRCRLMLAGFDLIKSPDSPEMAANVKKEIEIVSGKFPGDKDLVSDIRRILDELYRDKRTGREVIELMRFISEKYKNSDESVIRDWSVMLRDATFFAENDFLYKLKLCEQDVDYAFEATLESVPVLLSKDLSPFGIERFLSVANLFESKNKFDHAKRLFRILLDWIVATDIRPEVEKIRIACQLGIRRVASVGKPFQVEGVDVQNNPVKSEDYSQKIVLVVFVGDDKDVALVKKRAAELQSLEQHGLKMVIVGLGFDSADLLAAVGTKTDSVVTWIADKNRSGSLITHCPGVILPYGMIVDRNRNVARLAVYGDGLQQALESMIFDR